MPPKGRTQVSGRGKAARGGTPSTSTSTPAAETMTTSPDKKLGSDEEQDDSADDDASEKRGAEAGAETSPKNKKKRYNCRPELSKEQVKNITKGVIAGLVPALSEQMHNTINVAMLEQLHARNEMTKTILHYQAATATYLQGQTEPDEAAAEELFERADAMMWNARTPASVIKGLPQHLQGSFADHWQFAGSPTGYLGSVARTTTLTHSLHNQAGQPLRPGELRTGASAGSTSSAARPGVASS